MDPSLVCLLNSFRPTQKILFLCLVLCLSLFDFFVAVALSWLWSKTLTFSILYSVSQKLTLRQVDTVDTINRTTNLLGLMMINKLFEE